MYQIQQSHRNKWENQQIDRKNKNSHRRSQNKIPRRSSNSLKQEFRNERFNLQLFNRLYTNRSNKQYSLQQYLKCDNIYDDYDMIIDPNYNYYDIQQWSCSSCTYLNVERLSYCKICAQSYHDNHNDSNTHSDDASVKSSDSDSSITAYSSLSSYIQVNNEHKPRKSKIKRKKFPKKSDENSFKFNDDEYKKFKKYMKKRKTSIIAYKKGSNNMSSWNTHKMEKEKNNANKLYEMYQTVYLSEHKGEDEITSIVKGMTSFIPKKCLRRCDLDGDDDGDCQKNKVCKVCYCDNVELISMKMYCSHCMICSECFIQYLQITINDNEHILPWLLCPAQDCKSPIHIDLILKYISMENLYTFSRYFINKHLQRTSFWIDCPDKKDKKCKFGWIVINDDDDKKEEKDISLECGACGCHHVKTKAKTKR